MYQRVDHVLMATSYWRSDMYLLLSGIDLEGYVVFISRQLSVITTHIFTLLQMGPGSVKIFGVIEGLNFTLFDNLRFNRGFCESVFKAFYRTLRFIYGSVTLN